jgi:hypothetical protein
MSPWSIVGLVLLIGALVLVGPSAWRMLRHNRSVPYYIAIWLAFAVVAALAFRFLR